MNFWTKLSRLIIKGRIPILLLIAAATYFLVLQTEHLRFSYTEANLLPSDHEVNVEYDQFLDLFGEEGNVIIMGIKDSTIFNPEKFNAWNTLAKEINFFEEVDYCISIGDIKKLVRDDANRKFGIAPILEDTPTTKEEVLAIKKELFNNLPFYDNILYNKETGTIQTVIYLDKKIVNTSKRKDLILGKFTDIVNKFENDTDLNIRVSGIPYIRTLNAQNIENEMAMFVGLALFVTALIFFLFFRSFRATFITLLIVSIGCTWAFGLIGLFRFEISVLTALIPPLIIVISVPNAIFLINKYQQEIKNHGNQAKSLQRVISKVGNATLMTNITTASGFATFIFTKSSILVEFGILASINIIAVFLLALLIIPIMYSFLPVPKTKHLKHLDRKWMGHIVDWMEKMVRQHRFAIYVTTVILIVASIIGIYQMKIAGSLIDDMPKDKEFYSDIKFFEEEFGGIMPLEILIDTKEPKGVMQLRTLKKIERLNETIDEIPELSKSLSITNLVKYSKQAYYNGIPKYYQLPTNQDKNFILSYAKNAGGDTDLLNNFVDSTGQYARLTTYIKDIGTTEMEAIEARLKSKINTEFEEDRYDVTVTGKSLVFLKGTKYLINNLVLSLSLAIILIALFMAFMFRSFKMILISIIPNFLPLLITAGLMGYFGIPLKPSTILVFSVAFGISVDDTIHFLAKYRQELQANNWKVKKSVYAALRETGVSMFYTSIVLFFGFLVFTVSSFGGTVALGGLVSITLLFAMSSNLLLLPSMLLSLESTIANKKTLKEPTLPVLPIENLDDDDK
ncbi:efflux RND transporter permease subunit [Urechidicola vernalis]|uniref:Efflux RND transporter permease subunit n=1 Tax=Urechidicola vernalis TaxID=3075600 RepID=A0ABU2Y4R7_9FLAO|nr:efflux RND transporter permease subunit [Urechidicola sp. P050]MDT0553188.1 efflux RND transporter permease subunit [Urechidicola sp. P050]